MNLLYKRDGLALGICNGFQAFDKNLDLVPYGDIREQVANAPTLTFNNINRHISTIAQIRVATNKSPWLNACKLSEVYNVALSHGEGRFVSSEEELQKIIKNGQNCNSVCKSNCKRNNAISIQSKWLNVCNRRHYQSRWQSAW